MSDMFIVPISRMPTIDQTKEVAEVGAIGESGSSIPFSSVFQSIIEQQQQAQAISQQDAVDLAFGNIDDLHTVSINSERSAAAMELTVQMATRALAAYNEIIKMQI